MGTSMQTTSGVGSRSFWAWMGILGLLLYFLYAIQGILLPFFVGTFIAYALNPIATKLTRLPFINRAAASTLTTLLFVIVVVLFFIFIIPTLQKEIARLLTRAPEFGLLLRDSWNHFLSNLSERVSPRDMQIIRETVEGYASNLVGVMAQTLGHILTNSLAIINLIAVTIVVPILVFYLLQDWPGIVRHFHDMIPPRSRPELRSLFGQIDKTLAGFARGQTLVCLFLSLYYTALLYFIGLESALAVGIFTGLLAFIPYVGAIIGYLVSLLLVLSQFPGDAHPVLILSLFFLLGQILEGKFLSPTIIGNRIGLHPVWIIFSLFAGGALAGFPGMLIALPVGAVLGVLVRHAVNKYMKTPFYQEQALKDTAKGKKG